MRCNMKNFKEKEIEKSINRISAYKLALSKLIGDLPEWVIESVINYAVGIQEEEKHIEFLEGVK